MFAIFKRSIVKCHCFAACNLRAVDRKGLQLVVARKVGGGNQAEVHQAPSSQKPAVMPAIMAVGG